jgi:hypothetical protein
MDQTTQLVPILGAIATELKELGTSIDRLQTLLSPALFDIAADRDNVHDAQMLDLLSQRLSEISTFMVSLNLAIPAGFAVNSSSAFGDIKLAQLAHRLRGENDYSSQYASGDVDLF